MWRIVLRKAEVQAGRQVESVVVWSGKPVRDGQNFDWSDGDGVT